MGQSFPYTQVTPNVAYAVTASDTDDLPGRVTKLVAGTSGKIKVDFKHLKGVEISANQMTALGDILEGEITKVHSTGTDASDITAFGVFPKPGPGSPHVPNSLLREDAESANDGDFLLLETPEYSHLVQE